MAQQLAVSRPNAVTSASTSKVASKSVPAFLNKLYNMVDDSSTDLLIKWSDDGDSFLVLDHEHLAREVLGRWFKHQNFASFVRQLNMYGFHKIPHLQQGVLRTDADNEVIKFENSNFKRGQPDLLIFIQRKQQLPNAVGLPGDFGFTDGGADDETFDNKGHLSGFSSQSRKPMSSNGTVLDINTVISGITAIKRHQSAISTELKTLQQSNQHLWTEAIAARDRHKKSEDTINRILKFLAGVFGTSATQTGTSPRRSTPVIPVKRARLMIEDGSVQQNASNKLPGWESYSPIEESDLPVDIEDVEGIASIDPSDRFSTVESLHPVSSPDITPKVVESPHPSDMGNAGTDALQSENWKYSSAGPSAPGDMNASDEPFHHSDSRSTGKFSDLNDDQTDPNMSESLRQLLSSPPEDLQRLFNALADDQLADFGPMAFNLAQDSNYPGQMGFDPGMPGATETAVGPYFTNAQANQARQLENRTSGIGSHVEALDDKIGDLMENLGIGPDFLSQHPNDLQGRASADGFQPSMADFDLEEYLNNANQNYPGTLEDDYRNFARLDGSTVEDGPITTPEPTGVQPPVTSPSSKRKLESGGEKVDSTQDQAVSKKSKR